MVTYRNAFRSVAFVVLSILFSSIVHIALIIALLQVDIAIIRIPIDKIRQKLRPFSLGEVNRPELAELPLNKPPDSRGRPNGPSLDGPVRVIEPSFFSPGNEQDGEVVGSDAAVIVHAQAEEQSRFLPRQEILAISQDIVGTDSVPDKRRQIPDILRISEARDILLPIDYTKMLRLPDYPVLIEAGGLASGLVSFAESMVSAIDDGGIHSWSGASVQGAAAIADGADAASDIKPLEKFLNVDLKTYASASDADNLYFRLEISSLNEQVLPVLSKDVVFIQDSSASMAEQRLYFCRKGLSDAIGTLRQGDRFDVVSFSASAVKCFGSWTETSSSAVEKALRFVSNLKPAGNTDILGAMNDLHEFTSDEGRPCIAVLVSDGLATTGIVENARIISEFTGANSNRISVFTFGTMSGANRYLLDLLSYCNGGSTHVVQGGRWSIPQDLAGRMVSLNRPVLSNLQLAFAGNDVEVYPSKVRHLFLDAPMIIYGRCPRKTTRIAFQALGSSVGRRCDMIFDLSLTDHGQRGEKHLRQDWGWQKAYHLLGEISRSGNSELKLELAELAGEFDLHIPYLNDIE